MNIIKFDFVLNFKKSILAVGAQSKGSFAIFDGRSIYLNSFLGDLQIPENMRAFEEGIEDLKKELNIEPEIVVHDLHPDYLSTKYVLDLPSKLQTLGVQHHHAHILSCMAENEIIEEVIGVAFDGTGYGNDDNVWGGEFLLVRLSGFERVAHLRYVAMPGSQAAIREPWRMGLSYLYQTYGESFENLDVEFLKKRKKQDIAILRNMIDKKINSPLTSSIGRLFDAVSTIAGIRNVVMYEGEAAVELEKRLMSVLSEKCKVLSYGFEIFKENESFVIDPKSVIKAIVEDLKNEISVGEVSFKFHNAVCEMIKEVCIKIREIYRINRVALSGGVFQNRFIIERVKPLLRGSGFVVYLHNRVPCHDGGISLGQIIAAMANSHIKKCA